MSARGEDPRRRHASHRPDSLALGRVPPASRHGAERPECCGCYAASRSRGHCCGRALPGPANRLRELACVLLQRRSLFDPDRGTEKAAWSLAVLGPAGTASPCFEQPSTARARFHARRNGSAYPRPGRDGAPRPTIQRLTTGRTSTPPSDLNGLPALLHQERLPQ